MLLLRKDIMDSQESELKGETAVLCFFRASKTGVERVVSTDEKRNHHDKGGQKMQTKRDMKE